MSELTTDDCLRFFLPIYMIVFFLTCFVWRSWRVWRQTGINPLIPTPGDNVHDFVGRIFRLQVLATGVIVMLYAKAPHDHSVLGTFESLDHQVLRAVGVVALLVALIWTFVAQAQMGASWRIGVDSKNATVLVDTGVFKFSRNPIFVGIMLALAGLFMATPNSWTLLLFILGVILIHIQVRLEEEHLAKLHGAAYGAYRQKVRRWL